MPVLGAVVTSTCGRQVGELDPRPVSPREQGRPAPGDQGAVRSPRVVLVALDAGSQPFHRIGRQVQGRDPVAVTRAV